MVGFALARERHLGRRHVAEPVRRPKRGLVVDDRNILVAVVQSLGVHGVLVFVERGVLEEALRRGPRCCICF